MLMKFLTTSLFLFASVISSGQKVPVFRGINFDSSYSLVALASSFSNPGEDVQEFSFVVNELADLNEIQQNWVAKSVRSSISVEAYSINLFLVKNGYLVNSQWMIYPDQEIINFGNRWYNFDMKKFLKVQKTHALHYHSQTFEFDNIMQFALFRDSLQRTSNFLFMFEPTRKNFEGCFHLFCAKSSNGDDVAFVMHDINKELQSRFPNDKFKLSVPVNDPFNLDNKDRVKLTIECSKSFYEQYRTSGRQTDTWTPYKIDSKVIFKN